MTLLIKHNGVFAPVSDAQGASGVIHAGTGTPPPGTGLTGDYWHSTDLKRLYGPKGSDAAWAAAAMPVFRAATGRGGPGTLAVPTGTQVNDVMLLLGSRFLGDVGTPAGWTQLTVTDAGNYDGRAFYKVATQADIDSGITTTGDATYTQWNLLSYDAVDTAGVPAITTALSTSGTAITAPTTTVPADPDTLVVHAVVSSSIVADPGVTWTTRRAIALNDTAIRVFDTPTTGTDATGPSFAVTGNGWFYWTIVLDPEMQTPFVDLSDREVTQAELDALAGRVTTLESAPVAEVTQAELDAVENKIIGRLLAGSGAPAALSFVGAATGSAEFTTSASMTIPASAQVGDIMFVAARSNDGATASVSTHALTDSGESTSTEKLWYRVLQAGDPGSTLTVTFSATGFQVAALAVLRGQGAAAIAEHAATATLTAPSLNLAAGTTVLEVYFSKRDNSTISGGAGTVRATRSNSRTQVQINERAGLLSGPTTGGTAVTSGSSTQWGTRAIAIAIAPSAISIAVDGDFYLDKTNRLLYGPMTAGAWGTAMPLDEVTQAELDALATTVAGKAAAADVTALDTRVDALEATGPVTAFLFTDEGALVVVTGTTRIYNDSGRTLTILGVRATLTTAGSTNTIVDVNKDGTTLFTTQANRPTLATGVDTDLAVPDVTAWENGTYLTVDIDSAGTGAADLVVQVTAS